VVPGDIVYVTGVLGGPAAALRALEQGSAMEPAWRERFASPRPRLQEALWLAQHGVHALIDVSDGLASELRHMAEAGGVELRIDASRVPVMRGCRLQDAWRGGEEYELLIASPHALDVDAFARAFALPLSEVGRARASERPRVTVVGDGRIDAAVRVDLGEGHDHFST
jgi:thiamine-monophosphate kinase